MNFDVLSAGRIAALIATLVGLCGAVIGGLALSRAIRNRGNRPGGETAAVVLGLAGAGVGALVVLTARGGVGTGGGVGGAMVAILVGLVGAALGRAATARSRRAG